jgi:2,3-bisphosphoglycerate-independent phosphoglycerate mutase
VAGLPQSATGQAVLLTGLNIPALIGYHYGPKPNEEVARYLRNGNLFNRLMASGRRAALLNAYPPRYFASIQSGRRLFSAIPLAVTSAGIPLKTDQDLKGGQALSADFTGQGWREQLGIADIPVLPPHEAGQRMVELASQVDFSFFEFWASDYAGHHQDFSAAYSFLDTFDQVLGGLLKTWDDSEGLILVTSDHGNLEDLSTRRHTINPVPLLLIGALPSRQSFTQRVKDLTGVAPAILDLLSTT